MNVTKGLFCSSDYFLVMLIFVDFVSCNLLVHFSPSDFQAHDFVGSLQLFIEIEVLHFDVKLSLILLY